jgi:hypothetical protein
MRDSTTEATAMAETTLQRDLDASAIAPDTRGMNFYRADQSLRDLLAIYLPEDLRTHLDPHLDRLGALAAGELDECAALADKHPPQLHHRDRFGRDRQWIEYHPAYRRLEAVAYGEFGIHAMSHRPVLGWPTALPAVAKHAFTLLFNEAEFGLGCPINVTDSAAHLIRLYGDESIKARFLPRMLSQNMAELWQGAQFMTEKSGRVGRGRYREHRGEDGRRMADSRREMVLLECRCGRGHAAGATGRRSKRLARARSVRDAACARGRHAEPLSDRSFEGQAGNTVDGQR